MDPLIIASLVAVFFLFVAGYLFTRVTDLQGRVVDLDAELKEAKSSRPAAKAETSSKSSKKNDTKSSKKNDKVDTSALDKELDDARGEIKDLKKQVYDLKKDNKDLRGQVEEAEEAAPPIVNSDVVFSLREEIAELKAEVSRLETEAKNAKQKKSAPAPAPEPKKEEKKEEAPVAEGGVAELRQRMESELKAAKDEAAKEISDLEKRLKKTASNVDKQRRRADNNDRAYKITQRQLDAAQERLDLLEVEAKKTAKVAAPQKSAPKVSPPPEKSAPPKASVKLPEPPKAAAPKAEKAAKAEEPAEAPKVAEAPAAPETAKAAEAPEAGGSAAPAAAAIITRKSKAASERESAKAAESEASDDRETGGQTAILSPASFTTGTDSEASEQPATTQQEDAPAPKSEDEAVQSGGTLKAKPVTAADLAFESTLKSHPVTASDVAEAAPQPAAKEDEEPESGSTQVLSAVALQGIASAEDQTAELERPEEFAKRTDDHAQHANEAGAESSGPGSSLEEQESDGKRSSGLFGIPDDVFGPDSEAEEQDPNRSTQFAFPASQAFGGANPETDSSPPDDAAKQFDRESSGVLTGVRLASIAVDEGENPAEEPTPDIPNQGEPSKVSKRLGEQSSEIDDAWADLDFD